MPTKEDVRLHWEREVCGTRWASGLEDDRRRYFDQIDRSRYGEDYMLQTFADFPAASGKRVLEVGLGTGADFIRWVRAGADAWGRDLTHASVELVGERLALESAKANVCVGDAEQLDVPSDYFDIYYSWGVLHHTPDTAQSIREAWRVLKPGGTLKIMLYHFPSVGGFLVWMLHGPLRLRFKSVRQCVADHVESPGTQYFSVKSASRMVSEIFGRKPEIRTYLGTGDLLSQPLSSRYKGGFWKFVQAVYPRWFVRHLIGHRFGTVMTIQVRK